MTERENVPNGTKQIPPPPAAGRYSVKKATLRPPATDSEAGMLEPPGCFEAAIHGQEWRCAGVPIAIGGRG